MEIKEITQNKNNFMDILLIGDEQESMVNKYLEKGTLIVIYDKNELKSACVTLRINNETVEIKNIATYSQARNRGYATALLEFIFNKYKGNTKTLILGTGENEIILNFYKKRGFDESHRVKDFFIENYNHPIFENGKQLTDMIYLKKEL